MEQRGIRITVGLTGDLIQDFSLFRFNQPTQRHDRTDAPPIKDRPRKGHIGFQHFSRDNEPVLIRNTRIRELTPVTR